MQSQKSAGTAPNRCIYVEGTIDVQAVQLLWGRVVSTISIAGVQRTTGKRMKYNEYLFIMLFGEYFKTDVEAMAYDDAYSVVKTVYEHWEATDTLFGCATSIGTHDAMVEYLKQNADGIKNVLSR